MKIEEIKKRRLEFIKKVYDVSEGDIYKPIDMFEIGKQLDLQKDITEKIVNYLIQEKLIKPVGLGGIISITHRGIIVKDTNNSPRSI